MSGFRLKTLQSSSGYLDSLPRFFKVFISKSEHFLKT